MGFGFLAGPGLLRADCLRMPTGPQLVLGSSSGLVPSHSMGQSFFTIYLFIYLLLERGGGREKERERNGDSLPLLRPTHRGLNPQPGHAP